MTNLQNLLYDWNTAGTPKPILKKRVLLNDETLRDGLQSPTVTNPRVEDKIQLIHLMEDLGIYSANIGFPGAGPRACEDALALAKEIAGSRMNLRANCAARTTRADIDPILEISEKAGIQIECGAFIGSSRVRQYVEDWSVDELLHRTERAVSYAVQRGLPVMYVTEDTTRTFPETLRRLYTTAINCGAKHIALTDTVGHATPAGTTALVKFVIEQITGPSGEDILIGWHGHNDRGLSVCNSLAAVEAGADVIHGCALGIGERVGNTPIDQLLVNLKLLGAIDNDLMKLKEYCDLASRACGIPIPATYPVVGSDAFRTASGIHAAAVVKAYRKGEEEIANAVYSGVPCQLFGLEQIIDIGPLSGKSNIVFWLEKRGIEPTDERVAVIYDKAKQSDRLLTDKEVLKAISASAKPPAGNAQRTNYS